MLDRIKNEKQYVTLHVGLGTFKGIDVSDIREYQIHGETIEIEKSLFETITTMKQSGKKVVAVGTTACRTLESLPHLWAHLSQEEKNTFDDMTQAFWNETQEHANPEYIHAIRLENEHYFFETTIYIFPGKPFLVIDELITNFHLPESSLLVLVSALIGTENMKRIYRHAIEKRYRFFSF